jgi:hypothetical protein
VDERGGAQKCERDPESHHDFLPPLQLREPLERDVRWSLVACVKTSTLKELFPRAMEQPFPTFLNARSRRTLPRFICGRGPIRCCGRTSATFQPVRQWGAFQLLAESLR